MHNYHTHFIFTTVNWKEKTHLPIRIMHAYKKKTVWQLCAFQHWANFGLVIQQWSMQKVRSPLLSIWSCPTFSYGCSPGVGQHIALQVLPILLPGILLNFCFPIGLLWSLCIVSDLRWWQRMALSKRSTWNQMALVSPAARRLMSWNFSDASTGLRQLPNCLCAPACCWESGQHHCAHTSRSQSRQSVTRIHHNQECLTCGGNQLWMFVLLHRQ